MGILLLLFSCHSFELKHFSLDYQQFFDGGRYLESPREPVRQAYGVNFNIDLVGPLYWENRIEGQAVSYKFSWVGYKFRLGLRFFNERLKLYYAHWSQHSLDEPHPFMYFPVQDGIGVTWVVK